MSRVLVLNSGSSSLKYQLLELPAGEVLAAGLIERIGERTSLGRHDGPDGRSEWQRGVADHAEALAIMLASFAEHGPELDGAALAAVGHRVVQGARRFPGPALVDDAVETSIAQLIPLAPLHNPANLEGIRAARRAFPATPHVAVFDTSFHTTMPDEAATYALPRELARRHLILRYGAHGTSHQHVAGAAAAFLGRSLDELRIISLHIGNGASACAIDRGRSIDTSMGLTPLEGLVMGTRSGDLDPAILIHLNRVAGTSFDDLDRILNRDSGLLGLAGSNDVRDVAARAAEGDADASLALDVAAHRIRHYIGAYLAQLGGADAIVWTAGVGENSAVVRERALRGLEGLGAVLDPARNAAPGSAARRISADRSPIEVLVVPTNEELEIARQALELVGAD